MRLRSLGICLTMSAASALLLTSAAQAATAPVLYVANVAGSNCSDQGTGTAAVPYCHLQRAFDVVSPGQTVDIGSYAASLTDHDTLTRSGTQTAHIVVSSHGADLRSSGTTLTVSGAQYVDFTDLQISNQATTAPALAITNSSQLTFDRDSFSSSGDAVTMSGATSDVAIRRSSFTASGYNLRIGVGVSRAVISTNSISGWAGTGGYFGGIALSGTSDAVVVSNTIKGVCATGIDVSGSSTGTVLENNIIGVAAGGCPIGAPLAVAVSAVADSTATTIERYNLIYPVSGSAVRWGAATYATVDAYQAATNGGSHDIGVAGAMPTVGKDSPAIDSADSNAPGELAEAFPGPGHPRVDDPLVPNTGTGPGYYDRGAFEYTDPFVAKPSLTHIGLQSASFTPLFFASEASWGATYTGSFNWGDGTPSIPLSATAANASSPPVTHHYAAVGTYTTSFTMTDGYANFSSHPTFSTTGNKYVAYGPVRVLDTRTGLGTAGVAQKVSGGHEVTLTLPGAGPAGLGLPANIVAVALNVTATGATQSTYVSVFPDMPNGGVPLVSNLNLTPGATTANSVVVPVGPTGAVDFYNAGGQVDVIADISGYFLAAGTDGYTPLTPNRVMDTRSGVGHTGKVDANSAITLQIAGGALPSTGVDAVAVTLTALNASQAGYVSAYPDGAARPFISTVNVAPGEVKSNLAIVPVGANGKIALYNTAGSVDLIADVVGYFSKASTSFYVAFFTTRVLDTRSSTGSIPANGTYTLTVPTPSGPDVHATAFLLNSTITNTTGYGYQTIYPHGIPRPLASNVNWTPGETVQSFALASSGPGGAVDLFNGSGGNSDFVVDLFGCFATD